MNKGKFGAGGDTQDPINRMLNDRLMVVSFERWQELERALVECDMYKDKKSYSFMLGLVIGLLLSAVVALLI